MFKYEVVSHNGICRNRWKINLTNILQEFLNSHNPLIWKLMYDIWNLEIYKNLNINFWTNWQKHFYFCNDIILIRLFTILIISIIFLTNEFTKLLCQTWAWFRFSIAFCSKKEISIMTKTLFIRRFALIIWILTKLLHPDLWYSILFYLILPLRAITFFLQKFDDIPILELFCCKINHVSDFFFIFLLPSTADLRSFQMRTLSLKLEENFDRLSSRLFFVDKPDFFAECFYPPLFITALDLDWYKLKDHKGLDVY